MPAKVRVTMADELNLLDSNQIANVAVQQQRVEAIFS